MFLSTLLLVLPALADVSADNLQDQYKCVGTFIFGRHNDRVAKPAVVLTNLGAQEQVESGTFYRGRYFGLNDTSSSDFVIEGLNDQGVFVYGETYSQCPSDTVIEYSQLSFLQGLYPPTTDTESNKTLSNSMDSGLSNGTEVTAPFNGYQYVFMDVQGETSDDYYHIKGDVNCPSSDAAIQDWEDGDYFKSMNESTLDFYQSLSEILPAKKFPLSTLNFGNAMNIFDFMNVNFIHNEELAKEYNETLLHKVALLADQAQWGISYDKSEPLSNFTIGGRAVLGAVYSYLNTTKVVGSPYINYFTGSFNNMYQIDSLLQLNELSDNFTGMPDYGATYVWDLLQDSAGDYYVMFSFKNGTKDDDVLVTYPTFGTGKTVLTWSEFEDSITKVGISELGDWCNACESQMPQCNQYSSAYKYGLELEDQGIDLASLANGKSHVQTSSLSNAAAGGIGAGVTIGVFLIGGLLVYLLHRRVKKVQGRPLADENANAPIELGENESQVGSSLGTVRGSEGEKV
ncbi:DEKNAAC104396 [Brettanomyces naardenensis]|uniref:DEKNAAC104396 n=1 Tax=Brettanomyces naardenensis TaxID=13370 RepID=A0A448YQV5_BRENA|nr:DEKNAAC104396 [Brettanomyces naardenensis]